MKKGQDSMHTKPPFNQEHMTLQEIADIEGLSRQSIADILDRALEKARRILKERGIKPEDLL